jgi:hypothetical protein
MGSKKRNNLISGVASPGPQKKNKVSFIASGVVHVRGPPPPFRAILIVKETELKLYPAEPVITLPSKVH